MNAKQPCYIFKRRQWIDTPEQQRTFPSNLGSIYLRAPPSIHHLKAKSRIKTLGLLLLSSSLKAKDGALRTYEGRNNFNTETCKIHGLLGEFKKVYERTVWCLPIAAGWSTVGG